MVVTLLTCSSWNHSSLRTSSLQYLYTMSTDCMTGARMKPTGGIRGFRVIEWFQPAPPLAEMSDMFQLLAASACRGQFSSSMPESYSSSAVSLAGALQFKWRLRFRFQNTQTWSRATGTWSPACCTHEPVLWDTDLIYLGRAFPMTMSLFSSTAMMSECGTSNMGSRRSFSYWRRYVNYCVTSKSGEMKTVIPSVNERTMMDLSPRAPVFLSRAILAMAFKASGVTLSSHWNTNDKYRWILKQKFARACIWLAKAAPGWMTVFCTVNNYGSSDHFKSQIQ